MKATGIVRRIDDLGRVVIPKEIRRTMRIREGDPLEIYTSNEGEVIFKKYSPVGELDEGTVQAAEVISKLAGSPVIVLDRDHVVAVSGLQKKEYAERRVSPALEDLLENRRTYICENGNCPPLMPVEGIDKSALVAAPIISAGDVIGAVVFINADGDAKAEEKHIMLAKAAAMFLGKQLEE